VEAPLAHSYDFVTYSLFCWFTLSVFFFGTHAPVSMTSSIFSASIHTSPPKNGFFQIKDLPVSRCFSRNSGSTS
jgi:hypothetical protein